MHTGNSNKIPKPFPQNWAEVLLFITTINIIIIEQPADETTNEGAKKKSKKRKEGMYAYVGNTL